MKTDQYTKEFSAFYKKFDAKKKRLLDKLNAEGRKFNAAWIVKYSPYKIGEVLEVTDNKRMKFQRLVIYDYRLLVFNETPILNVVGWWLDKDNNPVKWEGGGYPVLNCKTSYTMKLSDNQVNNPVEVKQ